MSGQLCCPCSASAASMGQECCPCITTDQVETGFRPGVDTACGRCLSSTNNPSDCSWVCSGEFHDRPGYDDLEHNSKESFDKTEIINQLRGSDLNSYSCMRACNNHTSMGLLAHHCDAICHPFDGVNTPEDRPTVENFNGGSSNCSWIGYTILGLTIFILLLLLAKMFIR